jgi:hypothetical protein
VIFEKKAYSNKYCCDSCKKNEAYRRKKARKRMKKMEQQPLIKKADPEIEMLLLEEEIIEQQQRVSVAQEAWQAEVNKLAEMQVWLGKGRVALAEMHQFNEWRKNA